MRVVFQKRKRNLCVWTAYPPKRRPVSAIGGGGLHGRIPHDMAQLIVERGLGYRNGFWGCVADGASFRSLVKGGRKRTAPGVAVLAAHVEEIDAAEADFHLHVDLWRRGEETPVGSELADAEWAWRALAEHDSLELDFPVSSRVRGSGHTRRPRRPRRGRRGGTKVR